MQSKVNIAEAFGKFDDYWHPRIVADLNGQQVKVAKLLGEFEWHFHEAEDELFWVHKGELVIELRNGSVAIGEGEFFVVPRGVEHRPIAKEEVEVVLFEPATTLNTGNIENEQTVRELEKLE
jgi:mannose-6-phosphate isomerase-like protein (cupin superfamily)